MLPLPAAAELAAFAPRRSPSFYILRSSCALAADVAVDGMRVAYGTLSKHAFRQNALLKLLKHGLSCACCIAAGAPQGLRGVDPAPAPTTTTPPALATAIAPAPALATATASRLPPPARCVAAGCLLPVTLGVQSHLFFIISDLVRRPLHAACAIPPSSPYPRPPGSRHAHRRAATLPRLGAAAEG